VPCPELIEIISYRTQVYGRISHFRVYAKSVPEERCSESNKFQPRNAERFESTVSAWGKTEKLRSAPGRQPVFHLHTPAQRQPKLNFYDKIGDTFCSGIVLHPHRGL
jgi:hypothetical protein